MELAWERRIGSEDRVPKSGKSFLEHITTESPKTPISVKNRLDLSIKAQDTRNLSAPSNQSKFWIAPEGSSMRLVKAVQFLALLLLMVALFGGEVVESACFVNDVSNDYIQAPASPVHQFAKKAPADVVTQSSVNVAEALIPNVAVIPSVELSRSSASDLLRLLSIQRK
jgi:hypothetical protein